MHKIFETINIRMYIKYMKSDTYKIIIAGGRDFDDYESLNKYMDKLISNLPPSIKSRKIEIVSGTAKGADTLAEKYAEERVYEIELFKPDWDLHGKIAGLVRNGKMAKYSDALVVFWDGRSTGTKHMIEQAKKEGIKTSIVYYNTKSKHLF